MEEVWLITTVIGPLVLGLAIAFGLWRNQQRKKRTGSAEAHRPTHPFPHAEDGEQAPQHGRP